MTTDRTTRALRFHEYGEPADVLRLETATVPAPGPGRIRVDVTACGLAPADWALCRGLFPGALPRGVGCDVSGVVDAVGEGVDGVAVGDAVFGTAAWAEQPVAGAADVVVMNHWACVPDGLDPVTAAGFPMALMTAGWHLGLLGVVEGMGEGRTVLVNGAGTTIGFTAVQIALTRGARVVAVAGPRFAPDLEALGAVVVARGDGLAERVRAAAPGRIDAAFDTAPPSGVLPVLVDLVDGDAKRVMTCSDMAGAAEVGARATFTEDPGTRTDEAVYGLFDEFAGLAAQGRFTVPVAGTYALEDWREPLATSLSGHAQGKLLLVPNL